MTEAICIGIVGILVAGMAVILRELRAMHHLLAEALKQEPIRSYPAFSDPHHTGAVVPKRWTDYEELQDEIDAPPPRRLRDTWAE